MMIWSAKSISPSFKLMTGISGAGSTLTKSVALKNCDPAILENSQKKTALENIIRAFSNYGVFDYYIYKTVVNASWELYNEE